MCFDETTKIIARITAVHNIENALQKVLSMYEHSSKFMKGDINSQKLDMANMIVKYIVENLSKCHCTVIFNCLNTTTAVLVGEPTFRLTKRIDENFDNIHNMCRTSLCGTEYKFGRHSLEYVFALASLMDVYAIFGRSDDTIIKLDDFECLSDGTKTIFRNYYEENVSGQGRSGS